MMKGNGWSFFSPTYMPIIQPARSARRYDAPFACAAIGAATAARAAPATSHRVTRSINNTSEGSHCCAVDRRQTVILPLCRLRNLTSARSRPLVTVLLTERSAFIIGGRATNAARSGYSNQVGSFQLGVRHGG